MTFEPKPLFPKEEPKVVKKNDNTPRALSFGDAETPAVKPKSSTPKPLDFGDELRKEPDIVVGSPLVFADEVIKQKPPVHTPSALSLDNVVVPVKKKEEVKTPSVLFDDGSAATVTTAIKLIGERYPNLKNNLDQVERQVRQLVPLKLDIVMNWAAPALNEQVQLTADFSSYMKEYVDLKGNELIDGVVKAMSNKESVLSKVFGKKTDVARFKSELSSRKSLISQFIPRGENLLKKTVDSEQRMTVMYASLVAVNDTVGQSAEDNINNALFNRCTLMHNAIQQCKIVTLQIGEIKKLLLEQTDTIDRLLLVTIPAHEAASAGK